MHTFNDKPNPCAILRQLRPSLVQDLMESFARGTGNVLGTGKRGMYLGLVYSTVICGVGQDVPSKLVEILYSALIEVADLVMRPSVYSIVFPHLGSAAGPRSRDRVPQTRLQGGSQNVLAHEIEADSKIKCGLS